VTYYRARDSSFLKKLFVITTHDGYSAIKSKISISWALKIEPIRYYFKELEITIYAHQRTAVQSAGNSSPTPGDVTFRVLGFIA
jgi:hypothetical protein